MRNLILIITIALSLLSLQSCIFVAGAAAGAAGVAVVYDHRKLEKIALDQKIANTIFNQIHANPALKDKTHVDITCFNQVVLLTGQAVSVALKQQIDTIAHHVPDVARVYNEMTIKGPTSSLTRASDSWITTKIKTQMLATKGLASGTIKVVTENGSVYLLGIVSREQADTAVDIARQIAGVQRVVKIFQYTK